MKKNKIKKIIIAIIILGIAIFLFKNNKNIGNKFQDEIIFFKSFASKQENENKNYPTYNFKVTYKNTKLKNIKLLETINKETLIKNKIAPRK